MNAVSLQLQPTVPPRSSVVGALSEFLLELHRASLRLSHVCLRPWLFDNLQQVVRFDSASWLSWSEQGGEPLIHASYHYAQPRARVAGACPPDFWRDDMAYAMSSAVARGASKRASCTTAESWLMRRFLQRHGQRHVLMMAVSQDVPKWTASMSLLRGELRAPFSDEDAAGIELLMPHLVDAMRESRLREMARAASSAPGGHEFSVAVLTAQASIADAQDDALALLRLEWPAWEGPHLPAELARHLACRSQTQWSGTRITAYLQRSEGDGLLMFVRRVHPLDLLARRKRQVALLFSHGASQSEIALRLHLSPSTVNNYIGVVYEKLRLHDKTDLSRLVTRLEP